MTAPQRIDGSRPRRAADGNLLSHHAIMELVRPFSRRGYTVDLPASDRGRGVLVFRPMEIAEVPGRHPALRCVMRLERPHRAKLRVIRSLETTDARVATMTGEGDDLDALLEVVEQVDPERQFHVTGDGLMITRSYRAEAWTDRSSRGPPWRRPTRLPRLTEAEASLGPVRLLASDTDGRAFEVRLVAEDGCGLDIPRDFLAVLGWSWRPLRRHDEHTWLGSVKPPPREPRRTARLEAALDRAVAHIADTLAAPPTQFHEQHRAARWRAAFQRLLPLLSVCGVAFAAFLAVTFLPRTPLFHFLVFYTLVGVVVLLVLMDKAWRIEIPPAPSPLQQPQWWASADGRLAPVDWR